MQPTDVEGATAQRIPWRARYIAGTRPVAWTVEVEGHYAVPLTLGDFEPRNRELLVRLIATAIAERFPDLPL
jgi:hypothetical protein